MNTYLFTIVLFATTFTVFVHSNVISPVVTQKGLLKPTLASDDHTHEIVSGQCDYALASDLVYYKQKHKYGFPLIVRSSDIEYHCAQNQTIYCLKVLNEDKDNSTAGYVYLEEGGYGSNYVKLELESQKGEGFLFNIFVYAR